MIKVDEKDEKLIMYMLKNSRPVTLFSFFEGMIKFLKQNPEKILPHDFHIDAIRYFKKNMIEES